MSIGTAENAVKALDIFLNYEDAIPAGWKHLGSGLYRAVYLGPDGVAYKVQHDSDSAPDKWGPYTGNVREYNVMQEHASKPWSLRCHLYPMPTREDENTNEEYVPPPVLAIEYVTGERLDYISEWQDAEADNFYWPSEEARAMYEDASYYINDLHNENFLLVDEFTIKILDAAGC